jgi:hypothetical protein
MFTVRQKFEEARARAQELAAKSDRTDEESTELTEVLDRAEKLKGEIEAEAENAKRLEELKLDDIAQVSRAVALPGSKPAPAEAPEMTAGEYLVAAHELLFGGGNESEFRARAGKYLDRATTLSSDVVGIIPAPIVGPIIDASSARRKVFDSFSRRTMPAKGKTFERPYITQHVAVGTQSADGAALTSQKMTVASATVTKSTEGGTLEVPRQVIDWTEPEALNAVVMDFVKVYNRWVEGLAVAHLEALPGDTTPYDDADIEGIVESYVTAVTAAYDAADNDDIPLTIWLAMDAATELTVPQGATDRTAWSVVREAFEALDANVSWVTSTRLTAGTRIIGPADYVEGYEQLHGLLSLSKASNLATDLSYSGYVAFHGYEDYFLSISGT